MSRHHHKKKLSFADKVLGVMRTAVFLIPGRIWLDTGYPRLNAVLGSKRLGLPAGKMYAIQGKPHAGKTSIVMFLAALAQIIFNAFVIWVDLENSLTNENKDKHGPFYNSWASKFKLNTEEENFYRVFPKVLVAQKTRKKGKKTISRAGDIYIQAAESIFDETEVAMKEAKVKWPNRPIFVAVDSVANLQTALSAGTHEEKNMRTALDRAIFLSGALPKWQTLAFNFTAWIVFINQIRTKPGGFGDPEYSPGGNALEHNAHVVAKMRPVKIKKQRGVETEDGIIRAIGSLENTKNKAGGKSKMGYKCGYSVDFTLRGSRMWNFFSKSELKEEK